MAEFNPGEDFTFEFDHEDEGEENIPMDDYIENNIKTSGEAKTSL